MTRSLPDKNNTSKAHSRERSRWSLRRDFGSDTRERDSLFAGAMKHSFRFREERSAAHVVDDGTLDGKKS
jgi:hypothetical protein